MRLKFYITAILFAVFILMPLTAQDDDVPNYNDLHQQGRELYRGNQLQEALAVYERILLHYPGDVDAKLFRGRLYAIQGKFDEAEKDLMEVIQAAPDYLDAYYALASMYFWQGNFQEAERFLKHWISRDESDPKPYLLRAKIAIEERNFSAARVLLEQAGNLGADMDELKEAIRRINRPTQETAWSAGTSFKYDIVDSGRDDWQLGNFNVIRQFEKLTAGIAFDLHRRESTLDYALSADVYTDLWEKAYMNTRLQFSLNREFLPIVDGTFELFQGLGTRSEPALGYRIMHYSDLTVHIPSLALGYYPNDWYIRDKVSLIITDDLAWQNIAAARYFFNDVDTWLELMNVLGTEFNPLQGETVRSLAFALRGSRTIGEQWLLTGVLSWTKDEYDIRRIGLGAGLVYRW